MQINAGFPEPVWSAFSKIPTRVNKSLNLLGSVVYMYRS